MATLSRSDAGLTARFREVRTQLFASRGFAAGEHRVRHPDGGSTHVLEAGVGPAVLLVHGGVGTTAEWAPLAGLLAGRVIVVDRPGFGLSDAWAPGGRGLRADAAQWLDELLDGLGLDDVDLVGASMGGFMAIAYALAHPDRVRRLILSGAAGGLFGRPGLFLQLWGTPVLGAAMSALTPRDEETLRRRALSGYLAHPDLVPDDILRVSLAGMRLPGWTAANRRILRDVTTITGWRPCMRLDEELVASGIATTFICGEHDHLAPPDAMSALAGRMPDAAVRIVDDAGHIPHLDHPEQVAAAIESARHD